MRIYAHDKAIVMVGKASTVLEQLKAANKAYASVSEWIQKTVQK